MVAGDAVGTGSTAVEEGAAADLPPAPPALGETAEIESFAPAKTLGFIDIRSNLIAVGEVRRHNLEQTLPILRSLSIAFAVCKNCMASSAKAFH